MILLPCSLTIFGIEWRMPIPLLIAQRMGYLPSGRARKSAKKTCAQNDWRGLYGLYVLAMKNTGLTNGLSQSLVESRSLTRIMEWLTGFSTLLTWHPVYREVLMRNQSEKMDMFHTHEMFDDGKSNSGPCWCCTYWMDCSHVFRLVGTIFGFTTYPMQHELAQQRTNKWTMYVSHDCHIRSPLWFVESPYYHYTKWPLIMLVYKCW